MTDMREIMERREHKRFRAQNGVYVTLRDIYYKIGQLIDISKGGCAFLYIANGEKINGRFNIDLFSGTDAFYLRDMSLKSISDFSQDNEPPVIHGKRRRCGGQFDKLTQTQKIQLDYFIESHTNK
jgi:c-di-GMP-binding flagellar brake protein YcgR